MNPVIRVKRQPSEGRESNRAFVPRRIHLKLAGQDGPWADHRYEVWDGETRLSPEGARTDSEGVLIQLIQSSVERVKLKVWFYAHEAPQEFELAVQPLPDIRTPEGLLSRMTNLGAGCTEQVEPHHIVALQRALGLPETGTADDAFLTRVLELHGG